MPPIRRAVCTRPIRTREGAEARAADSKVPKGVVARVFDDSPAAVAGILPGDLILASCEDQDVAVELEQLLVRGALHVRRVSRERPVRGDVGVQRRDVETERRIDAARDVGDGNDLRALRVEL